MDSGEHRSIKQIAMELTHSQTNTGQHIQAHGGGILKVGEKWYWYAPLHTINLSHY
jgi:hypothetical protein